MITTIEKLKSYFKTGAKPTQEQFHALLDSYVHKEEDMDYLFGKLQGATYMGNAMPGDVPPVPTQKIFYTASTAGKYTNFAGVDIEKGETAVLLYDKAWTKISMFVVAQKLGESETMAVSQKCVSEILTKSSFEPIELINPLDGCYDPYLSYKSFIEVSTLYTYNIQVIKDSKYRIYTSIGGPSMAQIIFWDINGNVIEYFNKGNYQGYTETIVTIPENVVEMSICGHKYNVFECTKIGKAVYNFGLIEESNNKANAAYNLADEINTTVNKVTEEISLNLYNGEYENAYVMATTGVVIPNDNYACTKAIPIKENHYYSLSGRTRILSIACYDVDNNPLPIMDTKDFYIYENGKAVANGIFKAPVNAVSIRITLTSSVNDKEFNNIMFEHIGEKYDFNFQPSEYQPYDLRLYIKKDCIPLMISEKISSIENKVIDIEEKVNDKIAPRILLIGSSHGMNSISQLPYMFYRGGYNNVYIGNVYIGSFKLQELAQKVATNGNLSFQAFKDGSWGQDRGSITMQSLLDKNWDVIILQRSASEDEVMDNVISSSFKYVVDFITKYTREHNLNAPRILFNSGFVDANQSFSHTEQIMNTALQLKKEYGIEIIPNALALANARNTWLATLGNYTYHYLCYDSQHLDYGIGCWIAGATIYETIMRPLGGSVECVNGYGTQQEQQVFISVATPENYTEPTPKTMRIAKDCVLAAFTDEIALNESVAKNYKYKNRIYVFTGWVNISGDDIDNDVRCVADGGSYSLSFEVQNGAYLENTMDPIVVTMGGIDITTQCYNATNNTITVNNITDDVYIMIFTTRNPINPPV